MPVTWKSDHSFVIDSVTNLDEFGQFELSLPDIQETATYEFILHDVDGVITDTIHTVHLPAVEDPGPAGQVKAGRDRQPRLRPKHSSLCKARSTTTTRSTKRGQRREARISDPFDADVDLSADGDMTVTIDFRELSRQTDGVTLQPGDDQMIDLSHPGVRSIRSRR